MILLRYNNTMMVLILTLLLILLIPVIHILCIIVIYKLIESYNACFCRK